MDFLITTCDNSRHIVGAQKHLLNKYVDYDFNYHYLDLGSRNVKRWCGNVLDEINKLELSEFVVFGLDDFLPIDYFNRGLFFEAMQIMRYSNMDRYELGWGASRKQGFLSEEVFISQGHPFNETQPYLRFSKDMMYQISTQFSIWRTSSLINVLTNHRDWSPWQFEIYGRLNKAGCRREPVFRWIEESAISGRRPGSVNVLGLRPSDVDELCNKGLLDRRSLIYGWKGGNKWSLELAGPKYKEYYK